MKCEIQVAEKWLSYSLFHILFVLRGSGWVDWGWWMNTIWTHQNKQQQKHGWIWELVKEECRINRYDKVAVSNLVWISQLLYVCFLHLRMKKIHKWKIDSTSLCLYTVFAHLSISSSPQTRSVNFNMQIGFELMLMHSNICSICRHNIKEVFNSHLSTALF